MARKSTFSHSRLSSYETCPLKYKFRYLDKIALRTDSIEAFTGKVVHEALEWLYRELGDGRTPAGEAVCEQYQARWSAQWTDAIRIVKEGDTAEGYRALGERCLTEYYARYAPFDEGDVVGIEMRLSAPLDPYEQHWIMGFADRITRLAPGVYEIRDYKTGRWVPRQAELDRDRQLALYQYALPRFFDDVREVHLVWNYLQRDLECRSTRSEAQIESLRSTTLRAVLEIVARGDTLVHQPERAAELFPATTSRLCDWCDFKEICPAQGADPEAPARAQRAAREQKTGQLELF